MFGARIFQTYYNMDFQSFVICKHNMFNHLSIHFSYFKKYPGIFKSINKGPQG